MFNDNFTTFLDKKRYFINKHNQNSHIDYKNPNDYFFVHKNPLTDEKDYDYYIRCVNRILDNNKKYLFCYTSMNNEYKNNNIKNDIDNCISILKIKNYKFTFLVINYIFEKNADLRYNYEYLDNEYVILNIYYEYDENIEYDCDHKITDFHIKYNPIATKFKMI